MLEDGIRSLLQADVTVSTLTGGRIFPVYRPESAAFPCLTFQDAASSSEYALDGSVETEKRIQFDAWANTYEEAKDLQQAIRNVLDGFYGTLADGTTVQGTFRENELDDYSDAARVHRGLIEYRFRYIE